MLLLSRIAARICSASNKPSLKCRVRINACERTAAPPTSCATICAVSERMTSFPRWIWLITATALPMVPLAIKRAASLPNISAALLSSSFMVGSSPYTSSPTCARYIASRISWVGWVTVSLLKSIHFSIKKTSLFHRIRASAIFSPFARRIYSLKIILKYVCLFKYFLITLTVPVNFSWIFLVFYCNFLKSLIHLLTFFCGNLFICRIRFFDSNPVIGQSCCRIKTHPQCAGRCGNGAER